MQTRPSSRTHILDSALGVLRGGGGLSLDAAARAAGLSKPGLMYHFASKEALVTALVDHLLDCWDRELLARLPVPLEEATPEQRVAAYAHWTLTGQHDQADLVILTDPRLRDAMTTRWAERLSAYVEVPDDLPVERRARLQAVRLLADGSWFADVSGIVPLGSEERVAVLALVQRLVEEPA